MGKVGNETNVQWLTVWVITLIIILKCSGTVAMTEIACISTVSVV